jgi:hypothetical protein
MMKKKCVAEGTAGCGGHSAHVFMRINGKDE